MAFLDRGDAWQPRALSASGKEESYHREMIREGNAGLCDWVYRRRYKEKETGTGLCRLSGRAERTERSTPRTIQFAERGSRFSQNTKS